MMGGVRHHFPNVSLSGNKIFMFDEIVQRNTSKFATIFLRKLKYMFL